MEKDGGSSQRTEINPAQTNAKSGAVPRLSAISGPAKGCALAMTRAAATVGRHNTNDLVLADPRVSGVHLELRREGERLLIRDVGSANGTWLGRHRVSELELALGGELIVGDTVLRLEVETEAVPAPQSKNDGFGTLVGTSPIMREIFSLLERVSQKNLSVLVQGATGTGKEELARSVHAASDRARGPFIVVDAASLPDGQAESLLFGLDAGAGQPLEGRAGFFEAATGGTVFLDEVSELPSVLQGKLLGVLERREVTRVGGTTARTIDVRVIAATQKDLRREIEEGRFRDDLYFRLAQVRVHLPLLKDRPGDIPVLCQRLLQAFDRGPLAIDALAVAHLVSQPWPGNVRELKNVLGRAAALASDHTISRQHVAGEGAGFRGTADERTPLDLSGTFVDAKNGAIERFERAYLAALMRRCDGNVSLASREADVARHHLRDLLKKRGLYGVSWLDDDASAP